MRFYTPVLAVLALVFGMSQVGHCAATASVLSIVSPANQVVYSSDPPLVTTGDAGRVMIVYKAKVGQGKFQPVSAFGSVGNWTQGALGIPPEVTSYPESLNFRDIVFDASSRGFDLTGTHYGKLFYWQWKGGNWTAPDLVASSLSGVAGIGVVRRTGKPAEIVGASTVFQYYRKSGADWQLTKLPFTVAQRSLDPVYTAGGSLYLVGLHKGVPLVATLPPKADAGQTDKWALKPPGEATGWSAPFPPAAYDLDVVLDCPHQLLYATWRDGNEVKVAWAPVGATQASQWGQAIVPVPDKAVGVRACLRSNGRGGVGLLATYMVKAEPGLKLHWLSGAGLGAEIPLLRPGTATEASVFQSIPGDAMNFAVDAQGTAHVAIVASKRGEVPSGVKRLYYATVTGGGTSTADPETGGSGTTEMELEGPKPDFIVRVVEPAATDAPLHVAQGTSLTSARLRPQIEITNQGAQYFGDLVFVANVDGATVRIRVPDETNHRQPLFLRGQKRLYYLPQFTWEYKYQAHMPAHSLSYDYKPEDRSFPMYTGLGRKLITVTVDPDANIPEADEKNNVGKAEFVVADGYPVTDRGRINNQFVYGLNDVGLAQPPVLRSNTRILKSGYVQRPTQLDVVVGNMSGGGFYLDTPVVVTLDGKELYRQSVALMTREPNLRSAYLRRTIIYERPPPKPDLCGSLLRVPVDLTAVAEGDHVLRVAVDPDDKFADRKRDNNTAELRFKVRSPGGKLRVHVQEYNAPNPPVVRATVVLGTLWADFASQQGLVEIEDVPRGSYDAKTLWADRNDPEPVYFASYAPAFTVADNEVKDITIRCERAMNIVGDVRVAGTGRFLDDDYIEAFVLDANDLFVQGGSTGHRYRIESVPPGQHRIICGAYGFGTKETTAQIRRASPTTDDCTVNIELVDGPRATVTGKVVDLASNKPMADATVWLQGAPLSVA
ncbi:MAG: hypothetical protein ABFD94_22820, partial [Armatimonadia bacterium]